ncbi:MAG TPA: type VI secretion system contractile sheath large subunit [Terracidiphilus sp.]|nr:type VI secretion system contractile sheath large subunit [Terracidiphilus sp.]
MSSKANPLAAKSAETQTTEVSLLDQIVSQGRFGKDTIAQERGKDMVKEFINQVLEGKMTLTRDSEQTITARIAEIDRLVSLQLNEVLHNPAFQKLEATWRGIWHLVNKSETSDMLKIKLLNVPKRDLLRDLQRALDFDQSAFFKKVYEEEFGVFGGAPFGALVGDYEFGRSGEDIELLEKVAQVAAAAHAPFLSAAAPEMINLTEFSQLTGIRDVSKVFDSTEYARWKGFRATDDSRYVALTLPHVLMREPYGKDAKQIDEFAFEEGVDGRDHSKYLWGNAAYSLAARLTDSFARYGWCAAIRGVEGGGLVEAMATHNFRTDEGDVALKCPTEVSITDRREKELADQGFVPLVHCKGTDYAAFFSVQTANKPKLYDKAEANANARLSAQLPYMLAMSRFAHYLKAMMRDKLGSTMSRSQADLYLNQWIANYVIADDNASPSAKAEHPLREARIEVVEVPGKPGALRAVCFLRPHFQLDELTVSLRLVADLPQPAGK